METSKNTSAPIKWCLASLAGIIAGVLVLVYLVMPLNAERRKVETNVTAQLRKVDQALLALRKLPETQQRHADLGDLLEGETNRFVLRPVLGSYPAQRDIYRLAAETGFNVQSVREIGKTPTPVTTGTDYKQAKTRGRRGPADRKPAQPEIAPWFARYMVEVTGEGSYAVILALIDRLEQDNPYCGLAGLTIRGLPNNVERHRAILMLEWPVAADPLPVAAKGKGAAR